MKKRILSIVLAMSMLAAFMPIIANAETKYGDYLYYAINSDNTAVTITDCDESATEIVIPNKIEGLPVTGISYGAFYLCTGLTSVTIPESVTSIGGSAFYLCTRLTSVTIPNSVTSIGDWAFTDCKSLTSVTIPDSVTSIGWGAFEYCESLTSITIPDSVTSIGEIAFKYTPYYDNESNWEYGVLYIGNHLIRANYKEINTEYTIKSGTKTIADKAFENCDSLTSVTIPDSVTSINMGAFENCDSLTSVTIPGSVTSIGESAFNSCPNLTNVTLPDNLTSIGWGAFYGCRSLTGITIPDSVTSIGGSAFEDCVGLTSVTIPDGITSIGDETFGSCEGLTSVIIPGSVTSIGKKAFRWCYDLTDVYYTGTRTQWKSIFIDEENDALINATIHCSGIEPTPIPMTTAEIARTDAETDTAYTFEVTPETSYENCFVYAAVYDENGVLLGLNRVPLETTDKTTVSVNKADNGALAKVLLWADTLQPIISQAKSFTLK